MVLRVVQAKSVGGHRILNVTHLWTSLKSGAVTGVQVVSEKGCPCTVLNPWPESAVQFVRWRFATRAGEVVELRPLGAPPAGQALRSTHPLRQGLL